MVHPLSTPSLLPACPQILACSSVFLLSLNATYFKHALLLTSYSKIKLLYNPFVNLSQFLLSFSMSIYDVHPDCTFFFFFLSMFILKISDKKDVLKKKATLKGGGVFGQQLKTYLNGRGTEGKRIRLFFKKISNYESVPRLLCLFLSMCASGLSIFESVWNNFFFKNKISKSSNCSYLPSSWEQRELSISSFAFFFSISLHSSILMYFFSMVEFLS